MSAHIDRMAVDAIDLMVDAVREVPPGSWNTPSILEAWSVRELVAHATGSATKIVTLVEGGELWDGPSLPSDWMYDDPAERLRELGVRLRQAMPSADLDSLRVSPEGEVPLRRALMYPVSDLALHSWDLRRSLGRSVELSDELLALCEGLLESVPEAVLRRPGGFGPAQPAPPDSSRTTRLLAFLGRSVDDNCGVGTMP